MFSNQTKILIVFLIVILNPIIARMPPIIRFLDGIYKTFNQNPEEGDIKDTTEFEKEYDFVIVGAGSGGSVIANRLTEIENWNVLLIEAGDDEPFYADVPLTAAVNSMTSLNWGFRTDPVQNACLSLRNRSCTWHRGRVLGGTSVLNFMVYTRGNKKDYDDWASAGNEGWSYKDVLPYFIKSENVGIDVLKESKYHGVGGFLNVEESPYTSDFYEHFKTAAREMGYDFIDLNGDKTIGFGRVQANIRNGRRCSASKAFLEPIRNRENLHISKLSRVTKVLIDSQTKKAYGVEFVKENKIIAVKARKEVILSAGVIGSAHLLLLSGVGPQKHLEEFDIPLIKDAPVGYNLQDHVTFLGVMFLLNDTTGFASALRSPRPMFDYLLYGTGPYTVPGGAEGIALIKTKYSKDEGDIPDVELVMGAGGSNEDSSGFLNEFIGATPEYTEYMTGDIHTVPGVTITPILLAPKSRGRVSLKSKNPFHWPSLQPNYFQDERDVQVLREAVKKTMDIIKTSGFQKMGAILHRRKYLGCEQYDLMSDKHWECAIMHTTTTLSHMVGTVKMGATTDPTAVVDPTLKVIGVSGLRVVDGSIMPVIPRGHTNAVVYMIGEKASDMIKAEWLGKNYPSTLNNNVK